MKKQRQTVNLSEMPWKVKEKAKIETVLKFEELFEKWERKVSQ